MNDKKYLYGPISVTIKHLYWVIGLVLITIILCGTLIWINHNSWTIRFEIDDNTKEAIESIEWEEIGNKKPFELNCHYPIDCYENYSEYLKQFPDGKSLESNCVYAIYCSGLNNFTWNI